MRAILMGSALVAGMTMMTGVANAADARQEVKVPFDFVVNGQQLPAGTYSIERAQDMESSALLIQGAGDNHAAAYLLVSPDRPVETSSLVFVRDGKEMRLSTISGWTVVSDGIAR